MDKQLGDPRVVRQGGRSYIQQELPDDGSHGGFGGFILIVILIIAAAFLFGAI